MIANAETNKNCGSLHWNLQTCDCNPAAKVCGTDPRHCTAPNNPNVYKVAYVNTGRCEPKLEDCKSIPISNKIPASNGGFNEPWVDLNNPAAIERFKKQVQLAASKGYCAVEPDNTSELTTPEIIKTLVDVVKQTKPAQGCPSSSMQITIKNDEGSWAKMLEKNPTYSKNIAFAIVENCATYGDCSKYEFLKKYSIPTVWGTNSSQSIKSLKLGANDAVLLYSKAAVNAVTSQGQLCPQTGATVNPISTPPILTPPIKNNGTDSIM